MQAKEIIIEPFNELNLQSNSYDLTLGNKIKVFQGDYIDLQNKDNGGGGEWIEYWIPDKHGFLLAPNQIYLVASKEYTETYNLVPLIKSRSSIARNGIDLPLGAGFGDIGFKGNWTIPLTVTVPVCIYAGMKFCQIYYETIEGIVRKMYTGRYQNSTGIVTSLLSKDFENEKH